MIDVSMLPGRCPDCGLHIAEQGHRAFDSDNNPTGCKDEGQLGRLLGQQRRDQAFSLLDANDTTDETTLIRRAVMSTGRNRRQFTADDLPAEIRQRTNPNRRGRVFSSLLNEGVLVEVGRVKSANPKAHGKTVGVYELGPAA